jgi:hypothetical protein
MNIPDWIQHPSRPEYIVDANTGDEVFKAQNVKDAQMLMRVLKYLRDVTDPPKNEQEYWKRMGGSDITYESNPSWGESHNR